MGKENISSEEHIKRHKDFHKFLDEMVADFIQHQDSHLPSKVTLLEFMSWSHKQTIEPD